MTYTVGQMAKMLGLAGSTLRYYDKEGLLPFVERSSGGIRMFREKRLRMAADHRMSEKKQECQSKISKNTLSFCNREIPQFRNV